MISLPIIFREFQTAARRKRTFVVRSVFVAALFLVSMFFLASQQFQPVRPALGLYVLAVMAWITFALVLLLGPALTSACIAEEKQEGTLGLLFLTNMNAADVILGKWAGKGFPLVMLALAAMPFYFLPVLFGGVNSEQALAIVASIFGALLVTLSVGIFCSTFASAPHSAQLAAYLLSFALAILPVLVAGRRFDVLEMFGGGLTVSVPKWVSLISPMHGLTRGRLAGTDVSLTNLIVSATIALNLLAASVLYLPRTLHAKAGESERTRSRRGRRRGGTFTGNPILWLDYLRNRNWPLQCAVLVALAIWVVWSSQSRYFDSYDVFHLIGVSFAYGMILLTVLFAGRSFAGGKHDGSLELLMSTPLSNESILRGKLLAVLGHHGPYFVAACGLILAGKIGDHEPDGVPQVLTLTGLAVCAACVGLQVSAESRSVTRATVHCILSLVAITFVAFIAGVMARGIAQLMGLIEWLDELLPWFYLSDLRAGVETGARFLTFLWIARRAYRRLAGNLRKYLASEP